MLSFVEGEALVEDFNPNTKCASGKDRTSHTLSGEKHGATGFPHAQYTKAITGERGLRGIVGK